MPTLKPTGNRTTESALDMPSAGRALLLASRALRLRCPHCGKGRVLRGFNSVYDHCSACGFRFTRSDDDYFSGAMFFGMMIGETLAVLAIGAAIWITYPNIPWDFLQYAIPVVLLGVMIALFPVSRVVWLAIDVMLRPVQASELVPV
ncbi:MAG: putative rane protein [Gemmatimonadetes bacterium]|nr:putative rane protein [Gemmatimonadota bacterium]